MTWKRGISALPLETVLKPQESANARRFSFAVAGTISWTVCLCVCVRLSECNMLLDMPPDQRCFFTVSYQSVNMAVPLNGLRVDRGMYLQFSLARC